jgi:hypothetical protein
MHQKPEWQQQRFNKKKGYRTAEIYGLLKKFKSFLMNDLCSGTSMLN